MANGDEVRRFEALFADYVGAKYAIALCNGTATLHTALAALGVEGRRVAVPPLTMASTTIAVLHAGGVPVFCDVDEDTWLLEHHAILGATDWWLPVSLYGLHQGEWGDAVVDDAAQTLRPHRSAFTSYSFQASKILALGEGGMLVTNDEELATKAREFSSLGYRMRADQPRIDPNAIKRPDTERHHTLGWNYRMNDLTAERGARLLLDADTFVGERRAAANLYRGAIHGCSWIKAQHIPEGWTHDYWCYAVALESAELWEPFTSAVVRNGGEMPYGAWRLTYQEPAFRHLAEDGCCPVAEDLQPRLVQFQTNDVNRALRNADAIEAAIKEVNG